MKTIDFLPEIYRQREALRRARLWWGIVVVIFSGAIGASALAQAWLRHSLHEQLDELAPQYATSQTQVQELSTLQAQMLRAGHEAACCDRSLARSSLLCASGPSRAAAVTMRTSPRGHPAAHRSPGDS